VNTRLVENIADAVLYEGYMLYPYRASAIKNQQRWNFGVLYPRAFAESRQGKDSWSMQTECLAQKFRENASLSFRLRFLHLLERSTEDRPAQVWQEGSERDVSISGLKLGELSHDEQHMFTFAAASEKKGIVLRTWEQLDGCIEAQADALANGLFKVRIRVFNTGSIDDATCSSRDRALLRSLVSAHTILQIEGGEFISLLEPPDELRDAAAQCKNVGTWPVLVGEDGQHDAMLSSPIILYDYPKIAPESAGNLFDGTEIDEILTLRIMTMTDDEKAEMGQVDERAREILERTESMPPEQLMKMHGALRGLREPRREAP
jgi:hydrogenase maturation protease